MGGSCAVISWPRSALVVSMIGSFPVLQRGDVNETAVVKELRPALRMTPHDDMKAMARQPLLVNPLM